MVTAVESRPQAVCRTGPPSRRAEGSRRRHGASRARRKPACGIRSRGRPRARPCSKRNRAALARPVEHAERNRRSAPRASMHRTDLGPPRAPQASTLHVEWGPPSRAHSSTRNGGRPSAPQASLQKAEWGPAVRAPGQNVHAAWGPGKRAPRSRPQTEWGPGERARWPVSRPEWGRQSGPIRASGMGAGRARADAVARARPRTRCSMRQRAGRARPFEHADWGPGERAARSMLNWGRLARPVEHTEGGPGPAERAPVTDAACRLGAALARPVEHADWAAGARDVGSGGNRALNPGPSGRAALRVLARLRGFDSAGTDSRS